MGDLEILSDGLQFPEGPIALPDGSVLVVEIARGTLTKVDPSGDKEIIASLGGGPNGAAIGPDGKCYICNNGGNEWGDLDGLLCPLGIARDYSGGRIERVDLASGKVETIYQQCDGIPLNGPNDIVFDADGGFWFTDTGKTRDNVVDRGAIYYATVDGKHIERILFPYDLPNGIALSPSGEMLYFSETMTARIWQYELSSPGKLSAPALPFQQKNCLYGAGGLSGFDSMCVEQHGNICQATLFEGGISVISPSGKLVEFVPMPDPFVTNICFGAIDNKRALITLSGTGKLAHLSWPRPGLPLNH